MEIPDSSGQLLVWKLRAALFSAPAVIVLTIVMGAISYVCSLWDRAGKTQHRLARQWGRMLMALSSVHATIRGGERLNSCTGYVVVANHSSFMDIPALYSALPLEIRFFAKKGLYSIPLLGWHLRRAGHLPVVRGDARASLKSMSDGAKLMRETGISVLLFPEGGRTAEDGIRPFKEGAAYIAIKAGVPVLPVGLRNMRTVLPMGSWLLRPAKVEIHIGEPIDTSAMTLHDRGRLNEMLQERVAGLAGQAEPAKAR
ncbi:MAG TPA: lysophospholipid acyltransferase family protein [Bryobacteraceae bacterium]|jgi:1-acyl-sn-glycerol-3-phosphate acyltransferase|nr:lysophospholipid acyltransferase family protein [Bryobacteraceae bacterium]